MQDYSVTILGGGAVGLCLTAHFVKSGAQVHLLVRQNSISALTEKPIEVSGLLGDHHIPAGAISISDAATPGQAILDCDMLVLTTKAYDVRDALRPFVGRERCPPVLLLQNGMGSAEIAQEMLGPTAKIYSSAMMIGMVRRSATQVSVTAQSSPLLCGSLNPEDEGPLDRLLNVAGNGFLPMKHDPSIRETIAFKVLFNSCMNPTGAITCQTYGELLETPESREFIVGLADETLDVFAQAFDYRPARSGRSYVDETLCKIIFPRAQGHRSSMLQDLQAGRRTEIDFLNGAIIRLADSLGLSSVRHASIRQLIKACEASASFRRTG